jgi:hypothetical protein
MSYDSSDLISGLSTLSTVPELTDFSGPGLPFRGLDYIRNFNGGSVTPGPELWQTFDPGAFGLDPELAFSLNDLPGDGHDTQLGWSTNDGR